MPHIDIDGVQVHYRETGAGPVVVFLHGGASSGAQWKAICELLAAKFRAITVDHYGHGGTDPWHGTPDTITHDAEAVLVRGVIAHLGEPVHLVGHSYGGGVALRLACQNVSGISSLNFVEVTAPSLLKQDGPEHLFQEFNGMLARFAAESRQDMIEDAWRNLVDSNNSLGEWDSIPAGLQQKLFAATNSMLCCVLANMKHNTTVEELHSISVPTLALYGENSRPFHRRMSEIVAKKVPAGRLQRLPGAGHMSPLTHPQLIAEALDAQIQSSAKSN